MFLQEIPHYDSVVEFWVPGVLLTGNFDQKTLNLDFIFFNISISTIGGTAKQLFPLLLPRSRSGGSCRQFPLHYNTLQAILCYNGDSIAVGPGTHVKKKDYLWLHFSFSATKIYIKSKSKVSYLGYQGILRQTNLKNCLIGKVTRNDQNSAKTDSRGPRLPPIGADKIELK